MPIEMSGSENLDKSKDVSLSVSKGSDQAAVFGSVGVRGYKDATNFPKPTPSTFNAASATMGVGTDSGHSASITGTHIPSFGNQVTGAMNVNVLKTDNHKVDVNAFTTKNFPSGPVPTFHTHGGGVQYQYKDTATAAASVSHIPIAKRTDYSVSTGLKLHETPTSSFSVNVGASKTNSPFTQVTDEVSGSENQDISKDVNLSKRRTTKQRVFGSVGVYGYKGATDFPKPTPSTFNAAAATLSLSCIGPEILLATIDSTMVSCEAENGGESALLWTANQGDGDGIWLFVALYDQYKYRYDRRFRRPHTYRKNDRLLCFNGT